MQDQDMQARLQAALEACARMQDQRDQLADQLSAAKRSWPDKCPITRRDFFMEIDGVPTYGGPFDSYTIPEMLGTPEQPWREPYRVIDGRLQYLRKSGAIMYRNGKWHTLLS